MVVLGVTTLHHCVVIHIYHVKTWSYSFCRLTTAAAAGVEMRKLASVVSIMLMQTGPGITTLNTQSRGW